MHFRRLTNALIDRSNSDHGDRPLNSLTKVSRQDASSPPGSLLRRGRHFAKCPASTKEISNKKIQQLFHFQAFALLRTSAIASTMDLQSDVKAWLKTLTAEQQSAFMVNLQLSYASRSAQQTSLSSEPAQSVASLPMTRLDRSTAEEPLDTHRTWEPPDEQELAQYGTAYTAGSPRVFRRGDWYDLPVSGTSTAFRAWFHQPTEVTTEATAQDAPAPLPNNSTQGEPLAPPAHEPQAQVPQTPTTPVPISVPEDPTVTPVEARPPMPTPLSSAQPTPPSEPKASTTPSFSQPQPKVFHMDKNKQTDFLQPSDDETDPTASASTGTPLPPGHRAHQESA